MRESIVWRLDYDFIITVDIVDMSKAIKTVLRLNKIEQDPVSTMLKTVRTN